MGNEGTDKSQFASYIEIFQVSSFTVSDVMEAIGAPRVWVVTG